MAVARDEDTPFDSAMPTTGMRDAYAPDVARKWAAHGAHGNGVTRSREENRAQESPEGYSEVDERGYRHLEDEDSRH